MNQQNTAGQSKTDTDTDKDNLSDKEKADRNRTDKETVSTKDGEDEAGQAAYNALKEKLENSPYRVLTEDVPGIHSSLMKYNAEKDAVPMTLNVVTKETENVYTSNGKTEENLVKNITIQEEKDESAGSFAQVSKGVVAIGVLLCIGMVGFLIVFLVKKQ